MQHRPFGRTGWQLGDIAFGGWQLGGQWGAVDDESSISTLLGAFERGIDFVDTAEMYGAGRSEEVVGRALRRWRGHRVRVATKIQPLAWPSPAVDDASMDAMYPPGHLRVGVEAALRRLQVERIDLMQLHCWVVSGLVETVWREELSQLQREGKVDRIGVSLRDYRPDEGIELVRSGWVDSVQVIVNLFEQEPLVELLPEAARNGTAVIARVALDSGSLSGSWTRETYARWEEGSVLHTMFRGDRFTETLERVERLRFAVAGRFGSLAEAAIAFALLSPAVSTVVVGMSSLRSVERSLAYSGARFPEELVETIRDHQWRRNFYV